LNCKIFFFLITVDGRPSVIFVSFTVDDQPLRDDAPGRVITGLTTIVSGVLRPERLESQHAIVIVHPGDSGGRAKWTASVVLGPRDRQWQVATDHRARDAGPLAHVHRPFRLERAETRRRCNLLSNSCFRWDIIW